MSAFRLKYLHPRYGLFLLRLFYLKARHGSRLLTSGAWYGIEGGARLRIEAGGRIELGRKVFLSRRTDLEAIGGRLRIGSNVFINKDCTLVARQEIRIGDHCQLGEMVSIYDHDHCLVEPNKPFSEQGFATAPVRVGNNVWIGGKAFIKSGVTIGDNVIVGANAVVTKDVPANSLALGNPAQVRPNPRLGRVSGQG